MPVNAAGFGALALMVSMLCMVTKTNRFCWKKLPIFYILHFGMLVSMLLCVYDVWYLNVITFSILVYTIIISFNYLLEKTCTDALTGLKTRRYFEMHDIPGGAAVTYIDVDGFKQINDVHGHDRGDKILMEVADILRKSIRKSDIIIRMGGDEFVIITVNDKSNGEHFKGRLRHNLEAYNRMQDIYVSLSMGTEIYGGMLERTLIEVDKRMYEQKKLKKMGAA